ncbi:hypothetical protein GTW78_31880 [Streptomyces sp. SID4948]|nr:hypothetical protein [Streptomyces sp. SID4948]
MLEHTTTDDNGSSTTTYTPVVTFTTHDGLTVTGLCATGIKNRRRSLGAAPVIHYAPADPAVFTADPAQDRRAHGCQVYFAAFMLLAGVAAAVVAVKALT